MHLAELRNACWRLLIVFGIVSALLNAGCSTSAANAQFATDLSQPQPPLPRIESQNGRHALFVDGTPFIMLCAQANNSSNYEAALPHVWAGVDALGANTLQIPISWEQVEPVEGEFDLSFVDALLAQARERGVRVVPLWFGAFKNTSPSYAPDWVKLDNDRFPRMIRPDGDNHYALSPHSKALKDADTRAFKALMEHIRKTDPYRTVIMVQVENEVGVYGLVRDHSATAQAIFQSPVPADLTEALGVPSGDWQSVFGADANEYFTAYEFASYVGGLAAAGREILDLPMYANAALRHPIYPQEPGEYATGGPTFNVLDIWKAAAPALSMLTPDIYIAESDPYLATLTQYARQDNPLFVSETGTSEAYPRFFFETLGRGAVGFSPFGIDATGYSNFPLGAAASDDATIELFAQNYALVSDAISEWARLGFENGMWGVSRPDDHSQRNLDIGKWRATVSFDEWQFGRREWLPKDSDTIRPKNASEYPNAGVLVARLDENQFLVTGQNARIEFSTHPDAQPGRNMIFVRVEEVIYRNGEWVFQRMWNGDQTDYGLNFTDLTQTLLVTLGTYESRNESRPKATAF